MSFPRYPKYKLSGVEWLGEVPKHWKIVPLKSVSTLNNDVLDEATAPEAEIAYVDISSVDGINGIKTKEHILFSDAPSRARRRVRHGDVIVSTVRTYLKAVARIQNPEENLVVSTGFAVVRPRGELIPHYLGYLASANYFVEQVIARSTGVSYPAINSSEMIRIPVPLPSLGEQVHIAAFLDRETTKIDELVTEQQRLIDLLKEKRQAVISHAVTKGLNPHTPMKPSGIEWLGDVPTHWEVVRIGNLFREVAEPGSEDLPILSVSIHHGVSDEEIAEEDMTRKVTRSEDRSKYIRVAPGDLVYNMMRAWQGGFGTVTVEGMVSPAYVVARPSRLLESAYVESLLRTPNAIEQMRRYSKGVTDFRLRLYWDEFKNIRVPLPPRTEAKSICAQVDEMDQIFRKMSSLCEQTIALLQERRTALISAAVTGQIDIRGEIKKPPLVQQSYSKGFARQLLAAEILAHCHDHPATGRVKLQKLIHLCEHVAEIEEVGATYFRKAADPFDNKLMFGIASGLSKQKWFSELKDGGRTLYRPLERAGEHAKYLARWESKMPRVLKVIELLGKANTQQCEIVSTLYAAWNDLVIEGQSPSDAEIIREASEPTRWHESKAKIRTEKWPVALKWMREKGLVPTGFGKHTAHASSEKEPE